MLTSLLQRSARRYLTRHQPYVIGITGSIGKTTCRTILAQTLSQLLPDCTIESSEKNFNSETGLPLSILGIHTRPTSKIGKVFTLTVALFKGILGGRQYDILIAEYGIDAVGDMKKLLEIREPNIGILTGIDLVHAEGLGNPDITIIEKMQLINQCSEIAFIHQGTMTAVENDLDTDIDLLRFALHPSEADDADIWFHHMMLQQADDGTLRNSFDVDQETDTITQVDTNLLSYADAGYLSLSIQIAQILERRLATRIQLEKHTSIDVNLQPGRFSIIPGQYGSVIIDSSYNAAPKSMKKVLDDVIKLRKTMYKDFDLLYVLGDMRELGSYSEKEHRSLMAQVAQSGDEIFLVGNEMSTYGSDELIKLGYNAMHIHTSLSSKEIGNALLENIKHREKRAVILFKGSQNTIFTEEAIKAVLKNNQDPKSLLCRQDNGWMKTKDAFYRSIES